MKVNENVKTFVEKHKDAIIASAVGVGVSTLFVAGVVLGRRELLSEFKNFTNINPYQDFIYKTKEICLKDVLDASDVSKLCKDIDLGFTSIDDIANAVVILQKK